MSAEINKSGNVISSISEIAPSMDMQIKILDDKSIWARILHHNNHGGTVLFNKNNAMNIQTEDLYSRLYLIEEFRDKDNNFEFMVIQPEFGENIYRWKQTNNPTNTSSVTGYVNITNSPGGIVYNGNQSLCAASPESSNWWKAVGCFSKYQEGIPGFATKVVKESLDFYVRIDTLPPSNKFSVLNNYMQCKAVIES